MEKELVIRKCKSCGARVEVLEDCTCDDCGIKCCGEVMEKLVANSVDASAEKHVPTYEKVDDQIKVVVNHPMEEEHYIEWVELVTADRRCRKFFKPGETAEAMFNYTPGATIYAYCNQHGLWSAVVE